MANSSSKSQYEYKSKPKECDRFCFPRPPNPTANPHNDGAIDTWNLQSNTRLIGSNMTEEDKAEVVAWALGKDKEHFNQMVFEESLANITCDCGHGYFKPDKTWVSGVDVRKGLAPPKPSKWS